MYFKIDVFFRRKIRVDKKPRLFLMFRSLNNFPQFRHHNQIQKNALYQKGKKKHVLSLIK